MPSETKTGTPVTVSASELVSGSETKTANGTYDVTNLAELIVNVSGGGGASNIVTGTFKGTISGAAMDVTLNYSGSGYPVACIVYPEEGANNSEGAFYSLLQRYAVAFWCGVKENTSTPSYSSTYSQNIFSYACRYKSSETTASSQGGNTGTGANTLRNGNAGNTRGDCVRFKNATTMSVYIASTSYGFAANINYKYCVIYSS